MDRLTTNTNARRGIALLMVITVLVTLVLIAVPFAISMRQGRERTTSELAKGRAEFEAELLVEAMKHYLGNTHPMLERERWIGGERDIASDPSVDSLEEITIGEDFRRLLEESWIQALESDSAGGGDPRLLSHLKSLIASGLGPMNDDRGSIWTGVAEDANGRVNANGVSPFLLGNLLGGALLAEDLDPSAPDIAVEHVVGAKASRLANFAPDGGYVRIGNEVIKYGSFDGSTFRQCERGTLPNTPLKDNIIAQEHEQGTPVIDYVAYKVATHLIAARPKMLTPFRNIEDLRSVAGWGGGPGVEADRLDRIRDFLTVWSRRETASGWLASQVVVNQLPVSTDPTTPDEVEVRDQYNPTGTTAYLNAGTIVRITDGTRTAYQAVAYVGDQSGGQKQKVVTLAGRVDAGYEEDGVTFEGGETELAAWAPFPININTAPKEVLYACMANLHVEGADSAETIVTPDLAILLAERIVDERSRALSIDTDTNGREMGPFRHIEDYGRWLERLQEEGVITTMQQSALYRNAVNPHDHQLAFGTTHWCYRTLDVYHLQSRVAVNSRGGEQMATAFRDEVVEIGSDGKTSWVLDSQVDFEERLSMGHGAKWMASHPRGVNFRTDGTAHIQPAPRARKALQYKVYPSPERSEMDERGEVRLEPARILLPGAIVHNHLDSSLFTEGWRTDFSGAFTRKTRGAFLPEDRDHPDVFSLSFWWNSFSDANWTAFDCGMEKFQNRYAVFVTDGQEGPELVFRVCASPLERRGAEIFVPLERLAYAPGNWYHIHISAAGEDPAMMELLIDGVAVGQRRGITWLTGGLTEDQAEIQVESTLGFPDIGVLLIGHEVIEYDTRTSDSFGEAIRGARGTQVAAWPSGTPIREMGYSHPLLVDVMRGGATLPGVLGLWTAARLEVEPGSGPLIPRQAEVDPPTDPPTYWDFHGIDPGLTEFEATIKPLWGDTEQDMADAFQTKGIALMGSRLFGAATAEDGMLLHGWEMVYYERDESDTSRITIVERNIISGERQAWPGSNGEEYHLSMFRTQLGVAPVMEQDEVPCFLVPISVAANGSGGGGEDYLDPSQTADQEILQRYDWEDLKPRYHRAYIAIGVPNDSEGVGTEAIMYDRIERDLAGPEILFTRDRYLGRLTSLFFGLPDPDGDEEFDEADDADTDETGTLDEAVVREEVDPEGEGTPRSEDVPPPGEVTPPEEDPETDNSGAGENERSEEEIEYPEEIIEALRSPPEELEPKESSGMYFEPDWVQVYDYWVRRSFRGVLRSGTRRHDGASGVQRENLVLPCFKIYEGPGGHTRNNPYGGTPYPQWGARPVGRNDRVTFVTGSADEPYREPARIRWADPRSPWAALDDFATRRIPADEENAPVYYPDRRGQTRVLKFPCGELPDELPIEMEFARSTVSDSEVVTAMLDELHIWTHEKGPFVMLWPDHTESEEIFGIQPTDTEIRLLSRSGYPLPPSQGFDPDCGILSLDGELIVWRGARWEQDENGIQVLTLERCERGVLGTVPRFHPEGAYGRLVNHWPVTFLDGRVNRDAPVLPVARTRDWPREGLVRIIEGGQAELIHYTRRSEAELILPEAMDADERIRGRGLLRGRFGTDAIDHDAEALVFWQPFRYWDRYLPRRTDDNRAFAGIHDHPAGSYLEVGKRVRAGYWHRLSWTEGPYDALTDQGTRGGRGRGGGESSGFLDVIVLARFSPNVPWDSDQILDLRSDADLAYGGPMTGDRPSGMIYVLDDPEAENRLELEADTAEFRVFFVYRPGCFLPQDLLTDSSGVEDLIFENSWKRTPSLMSLTLEYTSRTSTMSRAMGD